MARKPIPNRLHPDQDFVYGDVNGDGKFVMMGSVEDVAANYPELAAEVRGKRDQRKAERETAIRRVEQDARDADARMKAEENRRG